MNQSIPDAAHDVAGSQSQPCRSLYDQGAGASLGLLQTRRKDDFNWEPVLPPEVGRPTIVMPNSVPVEQFNALLFQHNVLREEMKRLSGYLDGCDSLLGEMVRTIARMEERMTQLQQARPGSEPAGSPHGNFWRSIRSGIGNPWLAVAASSRQQTCESVSAS